MSFVSLISPTCPILMLITDSIRRKRILRAAQKSIMLWDPDGPARKPPRESVDLLLSVEDAFGLAEIFQGSTNPDFLLMTIGQTTRGAIERAYDWLIPIISTVPTTITRLPSSASCFLLLRAYGTEGDERKQLKQLAKPLLVHVRDSLHGKYGEVDSVKAVDLLMTDVASPKTDRRRCARRVLHDALEPDDHVETPRHSWMHKILRLTFARSLLLGVVKHLVSPFIVLCMNVHSIKTYIFCSALRQLMSVEKCCVQFYLHWKTTTSLQRGMTSRLG